jgi:hypothetical protein
MGQTKDNNFVSGSYPTGGRRSISIGVKGVNIAADSSAAYDVGERGNDLAATIQEAIGDIGIDGLIEIKGYDSFYSFASDVVIAPANDRMTIKGDGNGRVQIATGSFTIRVGADQCNLENMNLGTAAGASPEERSTTIRLGYWDGSTSAVVWEAGEQLEDIIATKVGGDFIGVGGLSTTNRTVKLSSDDGATWTDKTGDLLDSDGILRAVSLGINVGTNLFTDIHIIAAGKNPTASIVQTDDISIGSPVWTDGPNHNPTSDFAGLVNNSTKTNVSELPTVVACGFAAGTTPLIRVYGQGNSYLWSTPSTLEASSLTGISLHDGAYYNGTWILVGSDATTGSMYGSMNPYNNWFVIGETYTDKLRSVATDGTNWVAVGGEGIYHSTNPFNPDWTKVLSVTSAIFLKVRLSPAGVFGDQPLFMAVTLDDIWVSSNGILWSIEKSITTSGNYSSVASNSTHIIGGTTTGRSYTGPVNTALATRLSNNRFIDLAKDVTRVASKRLISGGNETSAGFSGGGSEL